MTTASASLNAVLARWIPPDPKMATPSVDCKNCSRTLKCCDFQPFVANFLLGAALDNGVALPPAANGNFSYQPLGLVPSASYRARHGQVPVEQRDSTFLCGFYVNGRCQIWAWRPGECSSFSCQPQPRSESHLQLSQRAFHLETRLAQKALSRLGFSWSKISAEIDFLNAGREDRVDKAGVIELYRESWQWARHLNQAEVLQIIGDECFESR